MTQKTWAEIKKYISEIKEDLGEEDWGEIRFLVKKMSPEERGKMIADTSMAALNKEICDEIRKKQLENVPSYIDREGMKKLREAQKHRG